MSKREKILVIVIVLLLSISVWQRVKINNLQFCSNAWYDMYWETEMENMILIDELQNIKIKYQIVVL